MKSNTKLVILLISLTLNIISSTGLEKNESNSQELSNGNKSFLQKSSNNNRN